MAPLTELPKGRRDASYECPIARALSKDDGCVEALTHYANFDNPAYAFAAAEAWGGMPIEELTVTIPMEIRHFISAFDDGQFPELEQETSG
jgi:hypothetical protein